MKPARIIVLVIAIAAGGIAALLAGRSEPPPPATPTPVAQFDTSDVLVASGDIGLGHAISPQELRWQAWPSEAINDNFIRRTNRPDAIEQVAGSITRQPFLSGEPIREAKLIKGKGSGFMSAILPQGMRAVSTKIEAETGAGGFILPNDRVDVIVTRRDREGEKAGGEGAVSDTILHNVRVLAIDQQVEEKNGQKVVVGKTATLEVSPRQAEVLTRAREAGTISLSLRALVDSEETQELAEERNTGRRTGVNVVRFGVQAPK
jgi:pilus assembly protein CpaB